MPLRKECRQRLVNTPYDCSLQLLCLLLQYGTVCALDVGASHSNYRTATAGLAPYGPIIDARDIDVRGTAKRCATTVSTRAANATHWTMHCILCVLVWASACTSQPELGTTVADALDQHLGDLTHGNVARAALSLAQLPHRLVTASATTRRAVTDISISLLVSCALLLLHTGLAIRSAFRSASLHNRGLARAAHLVALVLLLRGGPAPPAPSVAPAPGSARANAVSSLPAPSAYSAPVIPPAAQAAVLAATRDTASPPSRRIGYALRLPGKPVSRNGKRAATGKSNGIDSSVAKPWLTSTKVDSWLRLIIDSGSTWHVHNRLADLSNVKALSRRATTRSWTPAA